MAALSAGALGITLAADDDEITDNTDGLKERFTLSVGGAPASGQVALQGGTRAFAYWDDDREYTFTGAAFRTIPSPAADGSADEGALVTGILENNFGELVNLVIKGGTLPQGARSEASAVFPTSLADQVEGTDAFVSDTFPGA